MTELSKQQAMSLLGVSERTLERYVKKSRISVKYITVKGIETPFFDEGELLDFLNEQQAPKHKPALTSLPQKQINDVLLTEADKSIVYPAIELFATSQLITALSHKFVLSIKEASILSGLSLRHLKVAIKENNLKALKLGNAWKIRQLDLNNYVNQIFGS